MLMKICTYLNQPPSHFVFEISVIICTFHKLPNVFLELFGPLSWKSSGLTTLMIRRHWPIKTSSFMALKIMHGLGSWSFWRSLNVLLGTYFILIMNNWYFSSLYGWLFWSLRFRFSLFLIVKALACSEIMLVSSC